MAVGRAIEQLSYRRRERRTEYMMCFLWAWRIGMSCMCIVGSRESSAGGPRRECAREVQAQYTVHASAKYRGPQRFRGPGRECVTNA